MILKRLKVHRLRLRECVIVVDARQLAAMRHRVSEPFLGAFTWLHHYMARHGEETLEPFAHGKAFGMAREHLADTPHCDLAPGIFPRGIELPITEYIS